MKTNLKRFPGQIAAVLLALIVIGSPAHAKYGGGVMLSSSSKFGAIGVAGSFSSSSTALTAARKKAGGTNHAWSGRWWTHRGYGATVRGYTRYGTGVQPAYAYGYSTSTSAVNAAKKKLSSSYKYSVGWAYAYNN